MTRVHIYSLTYTKLLVSLRRDATSDINTVRTHKRDAFLFRLVASADVDRIAGFPDQRLGSPYTSRPQRAPRPRPYHRLSTPGRRRSIRRHPGTQAPELESRRTEGNQPGANLVAECVYARDISECLADLRQIWSLGLCAANGLPLALAPQLATQQLDQRPIIRRQQSQK